jgi:hypothetical protein
MAHSRCKCGCDERSHDSKLETLVGWTGRACRNTWCGCVNFDPTDEPQGETVKLFEPASAQIPGQLAL